MQLFLTCLFVLLSNYLNILECKLWRYAKSAISERGNYLNILECKFKPTKSKKTSNCCSNYLNILECK